MNTLSPIEVTRKYATTVPELTDAFAFVMARIDDVGPDPQVQISPFWSSSDDFTGRKFEVVVSGMVEEPE